MKKLSSRRPLPQWSRRHCCLNDGSLSMMVPRIVRQKSSTVTLSGFRGSNYSGGRGAWIAALPERCTPLRPVSNALHRFHLKCSATLTRTFHSSRITWSFYYGNFPKISSLVWLGLRSQRMAATTQRGIALRAKITLLGDANFFGGGVSRRSAAMFPIGQGALTGLQSRQRG